MDDLGVPLSLETHWKMEIFRDVDLSGPTHPTPEQTPRPERNVATEWPSVDLPGSPEYHSLPEGE